MYKFSFLFLSTLLSLQAYAQIDFEKGYFINEDGSRTEAYIKNKEWLGNPTEFTYTDQPGGEAKIAKVETIREFAVGNSKFIRSTVKIDNSVNQPGKLSSTAAPEFVTETVLLKVLIEGSADLFYYRRKGEDRFFFRTGDGPINQLVYKKFLGPNNMGAYNNTFQDQLKYNVNCTKQSDQMFKRLRYDETSMKKHFIAHNVCSGDVQQTSAKDVRKRIIHLKVTPGVDFANAHAVYPNNQLYAEYNSKPGFRLGVDMEIVLPFNRNKWAAMIEPTFQSYKSESKAKNKQKIEYTSVEIPLGVRHYFFLNKSTTIFLDAGAVFDVPFKYETTTFDAKIPSVSVMAGVGVSFRKFSIEARHYFERSVIAEGTFSDYLAEYEKSSLILGYRIF
jgi:hypothetical protein